MLLIDKKIINADKQSYTIINFYDEEYKIRGLYSGSSYMSFTYCDNEKKFDLYDKYSQLYDILNISDSSIRSALMLGGGCFSFPKYLISNYDDKTIDSVEYDKGMIHIAYEYFYLNDLYEQFDKDHKRLTIINDNALTYIYKTKKTYDIIYIDLFVDSRVVIDIFNDNNIKRMHDILSSKKYLLVNYIYDEKYSAKELVEIYESLNKHFKQIVMITMKNINYNKGYNILIICSNKKIILSNKLDYDIYNFNKITLPY